VILADSRLVNPVQSALAGEGTVIAGYVLLRDEADRDRARGWMTDEISAPAFRERLVP
jgi:hypothetical protein